VPFSVTSTLVPHASVRYASGNVTSSRSNEKVSGASAADTVDSCQGEGDLGAVGLVPDCRHRALQARDRGPQGGHRGSGCEAVLDAQLRTDRSRDRLGGLTGAQQRAGQNDGRRSRMA